MLLTDNILRKLSIGLIIILLIIISWASLKHNNAIDNANAIVSDSHRIIFFSEKIFSGTIACETDSKIYVLTGENYFLNDFKITQSQLSVNFDTLKKLTSYNDPLTASINYMQNVVLKRISFSDSIIQLKQIDPFTSQVELVTYSRSDLYLVQIRALTSAVQEIENKLLQYKIQTSNKQDAIDTVMVSFCVLVLLGMLAFVFITQKQRAKNENQKKSISILNSIAEKASLNKINVVLRGNIAERKQQVYKNEKQFRALIESSHDVIVLLDKNFKIFYCSASTFPVTGFKNEEVLGCYGAKFIHPNNLRELYNKIKESLLNEGIPIPTIFRFKNKTDHYICIEGSFTNLLNDENVKGVVFNFRDVTERIQSVEKLASSEIRFRSLIENSEEGIVLMDKNSFITYRSPVTQKAFGWGITNDTIGLTHPDDLVTMKYKRVQTLKKPGIPISFLCRIINKDGKYFWMEGTLTNFLYLKGVHAIVLNYRDVSQKKEAEEKLITNEKLYRSLFENMDHGFAYCEAILKDDYLIDFTYLAVNNQYETMLGIKNAAGKKISQVLPGLLEADPSYAMILGNVAVTGIPHKFDTYIPDVNRWISLSLYSPAKNYFVGLLDDVTDRKEREKATNQVKEQLEVEVAKRTDQLKKTNEELEAFTYSVSHDLRAPLRGIIGFATILEDDYTNKLDDGAKRITSIIKNNTAKMGILIDDLLNFSKLSRQQIAKTNISMNEMVKEIILTTVNKTHQHIEWTVSNLPIVAGDGSTLRQVWTNLIQNAIKYSSKNTEPAIRIGLNETRNEYIFFIKDNGVGFDMRYKKKLFKVFQRLHSDADFEGTGVGLAIVEKIINKHGGRVWAEAIPTKGACFYFSLPK